MPPPPATDDPGAAGAAVLAAERDRLAFARDCLARMREAVEAVQARGGDPVSDAHLRAALHRRQRALVDDPGAPLFFGRIDRPAPAGGTAGAGGADAGPVGEFYIGRRFVRDDAGDPVVIDWRAPTSRDFYRASRSDPRGVGLRRRYGFSGGALTSLEDEHLGGGSGAGAGGADAGAAGASRLLTAEIERPRTGPMRDIVATIQPEQDELVRADLARTVCVQGAPGTGKTAVGLHRAAYLLYAHGEQLRRAGVLVVGPNRSFLGYIAALLPALGEVDVTQVAAADLVDGVEATADDAPEVAALKGDERMAVVLARALRSRLRAPTEDLLVPVDSRRWRVPREQLAALVDAERRRGTSYDVARGRLGALVAALVRAQIEAEGGAPDERATARTARSPAVRGWVDAHWPKTTPADVLTSLLTDADALAAAAEGVLDAAEQQLLSRPAHPPRPARAGRGRRAWSLGDAFCLDEVAGLLARPPAFGHVVVDEAQDLTAMQCRALARRCPAGSMTVLGDLAQATASGAVADWDRALDLLGQGEGRVVGLTRGYRVPEEVLDLANRLLPALGVAVAPATSQRRAPGSLRLRPVAGPGDLGEEVAAVVAALTGRGGPDGAQGSVGVVAAGPDLAAAVEACRAAGVEVGRVEDGLGAGVTAVPVELAKGLEFDHVVVVEPASIEAGARGLHWLYVALTRAVTSLSVVHARPLPEALRR